MQKHNESFVARNWGTVAWSTLYLLCTFVSGTMGARFAYLRLQGGRWPSLVGAVLLLLAGVFFAGGLYLSEKRRNAKSVRDVAGADRVFLGIYGILSIFLSWMPGYLFGQYLYFKWMHGDWSPLLLVGMYVVMAIGSVVRLVRLERQTGAF
jgi:hypothetical protein